MKPCINKPLSFIFAVTFYLISVSNAFAVELFFDNFNSYANSSALQAAIINGTTPWEVARFEPGFRYMISDVGIGSSQNFGEDKYAFMLDDTGLMFHVNTVGLENAVLSFDWRTSGGESIDHFVAGFHQGPLTTNANHITNFAGNGLSWWSNEWTQIVRGRSLGATISNYLLPGGVSDLWIAFWLDDSSCSYGVGLIDNVRVTGREVPEPATALLLGAGLLYGVRSRRRKNNQ